MLTPYIELSTQRLALRAISENDWEEILYLRSDPEVSKYIRRVPPETKDDALEFIRKVRGQVSRLESYNWKLCESGSEKMIGNICLWNITPDRRQAELGYDLHPDHQGRGLMSEAVEIVLSFGFEVMELDRVLAYTHRENLASRKLLERHGFEWVESEVDPENEDNVIYTKKNNWGHHRFLKNTK